MIFMNHLIITFLLLSLKRAISDESSILPRGESFFEVKNWTALLRWENESKTDIFPELFELKNGGDEELIGVVNEYGNLYNAQDVSLCQRRVFQIKVNGGESDPLVWTPRSYQDVKYYIGRKDTTLLNVE